MQDKFDTIIAYLSMLAIGFGIGIVVAERILL